MLEEKSSVFEYSVLIVGIIAVLLPIVYMLVIALTPHKDLFVRFLPRKLTLQNFVSVLKNIEIMRIFANTWIIGVATAVLTVILSALAGYGLSRFRSGTQNLFIVTILITQMLPIEILVLSYFRVLQDLNLYNTLTGLVLLDSTLAIPFCTLMLKSIFDRIPKEIEDAAQIDGCSRTSLLLRIVFPICKPGLFAAGIFSFLMSWSEYLYALTFTSDYRARPITVEIARLVGHYVTSWEKMMALAFLGSLPILLLFAFTQDIFLRGMVLGAVKE